MRNPTTSLLPVLSVVLLLGVLGGMAEDVAAQDGCTTCVYLDPDEGPPRAECEPKKGKGYEWCENFVKWKDCQMSSEEEDCGLGLALDGRAEHVGSGVATVAIGGTGIPGWGSLVLPAAETLPAVARQTCVGVIVHQRYSAARISELRAGLRRVKI